MPPSEWDAATYDRIADPQTRWGAEVLGQLVAQCGGASNLATVAEALQRLGATGFVGNTYSPAEETAARLERSGFVEVRCWLSDEPTFIRIGV